MDMKKLLLMLGFKPKDNAIAVYSKIYQQHDSYAIEVDFSKEFINYGKLIKADCKTTQNFSQDENWVVLECVDRLLAKGYKPQNIILEKTWAAGHGTSGRLDICVTRNDGSEYLMIECKTWGKEFDKELNNLNKSGGQLFTYFKFSNKADVLMLYASRLEKNNLEYRNAIIKIEDEYRAGDVKDFYDKWNKLTKDNGVFEAWVAPYCFESKALIKSQLKPITQDDSSFIFNQFLEILRHNVVSDKGNAFNKIFTLFLCKVYDETSKTDEEELDFQWKEGQDDHVSFQLRLTDLYKKGMEVFLSRVVSDFDEKEFENKYQQLSSQVKEQLLKEINILRLEKNNEFAIKEVYDHDSFVENAKIVKEVVELLQGYRIRYNKRQQYLSDFFELLLTTGLKQEAGQFFTPVPIAQFIIKSLPLDDIVNEKLHSKDGNILPYMIDYAAGSGHFVTEYMHEVQNLINEKQSSKFIDKTAKKIKTWQNDQYDWATDYVYGIEKDYRLVKVGKVGCYLHGDGLANVILSDGLGNFVKTKDYKGKLRKSNDDNSKDNQQFDVVLSNPPYSVYSFKQTTRDYYTEKDFELYSALTDNSSEIECLFVERTKQLLKDGGIAGIILPSSILTNAGIYTKTRELLLKYFEIIAITELGSNTFMATGTNTVVLFLRRRNNYDCVNLQKSVDKFFTDLTDVTINGIEAPVAKYVNYVWEGLTFDDYITLLSKEPNDKVRNHDLFKEYSQKIKTKNDKDFYDKVIGIEKEKIYYFILAYPQKLVVIKTGEKDAEKRFLGYEFSNRRGSEGIHAIQKNKSVDECTRLFDINTFDNPQKASTYIYKAFKNEEIEIDETLKNNISKVDLLDMMTFDRVDFEKVINVKAKKKIKVESKWELKTIDSFVTFESGSRPTGGVKNNTDGILSLGGEHIHNVSGNIDLSSPKYVSQEYYDNATKGKIKKADILLCKDGALTGKVAIVRNELNNIFAMVSEHVFILRTKNLTTQKYLFNFLHSIQGQLLLKSKITGAAQGGLNTTNLKSIQIPLPPLEIQQKIVDEIEKIEDNSFNLEKNISKQKEQILTLIDKCYKDVTKIKLKKVVITNPSKIEIANLNLDTDISFIDMQSVSNNGYIEREVVKKYSEVKKGSYTYFKKHDVIIAKITPCMENGKCACTESISKNIGFGSSEFHVFRPTDKILSKYIFYILNRDTIRKEAEKQMTGASGHKRVPIGYYENLEIPLPTLNEQQKIVAQIEEYEKQIAEAQKAIDVSTELKNAVLQKYL